MKIFTKFQIFGLLTFLLLFQNCSVKSKSNPETKNQEPKFYTVEDFEWVEKIDAHVHIRTEDTAFVYQALEDNFKLINIDVYKTTGPGVEEQRKRAVSYLKTYPNHIGYVTTFSMEDWGRDDWKQRTIQYLENSFDQGAIGVKVWKNIGMELKDEKDNFIMIDHPKLDPVFDYIAQSNIPLLSHQGEPKDCWLPLEEMSIGGNRNYYSKNPEYHMYLHPEYPSYEEQIDARDNMLAKHPDLNVICVHLASLEWSIEELAKRLDKFPNMAVDMAARISHLQLQTKENWQQVHDFFIKYQDRILYATDIIITDESKNSSEMRQRVHDRWINDWRYLSTDEVMESSSFEGDFKGLKLPKEVINKVYRENAEKWLPGMTNQ